MGVGDYYVVPTNMIQRAFAFIQFVPLDIQKNIYANQLSLHSINSNRKSLLQNIFGVGVWSGALCIENFVVYIKTVYQNLWLVVCYV